MSTPNGPASWRVDSQVPRTRANATGGIEDGYDIAFTTGMGHPGTVFVPMARYQPDVVRAMIQAQADVIDAVGSLTSGDGG